MMTINLLSLEQKKIINEKRFNFYLQEIAVLIFIFTFVAGGILFFSKFILQQQLKQTITSINQTTVDDANREISEINNEIKLVGQLQNKNYKWSTLMQELSQITPDGIVFNSAKIYSNNHELELIGTAKKRGDLLDFQNKLISTGYFEKFELPITSLISQENNQFSLKLKIINDKLFK